MIARAKSLDPNAPILVIDVGNSATHMGRWCNGEVTAPVSLATNDNEAFTQAFAKMRQTFEGGRPPAVVAASVVPAALERIRTRAEAALERKILVVGDTLPLPIDVGVRDPKAMGVDRVCAAGAAYDRLRAACAIVDLGTAVTVDVVDDEGTLLGGAILPGMRLQLQSLHARTAQLPQVSPGMPELPFGRDTAEAIQNGVCRGLLGALRELIEAYATHLNKWPQVVATGGDLPLVAAHVDFFDSLVPDLTLRGVGLAYAKYLAAKGA